MYVCMYVRNHVCMYGCMYACMYVYVLELQSVPLYKCTVVYFTSTHVHGHLACFHIFAIANSAPSYNLEYTVLDKFPEMALMG